MTPNRIAAFAALAIVTLLAAPQAAPPSQEPAKSPTVTTLAASPSPSSPSQEVTLTATVRPKDTGVTDVPAGVVEFFDAAGSLGIVPLIRTDTGTSATLTVTLTAGPHPLSATYKGDLRCDVSISQPLMHMVHNP